MPLRQTLSLAANEILYLNRPDVATLSDQFDIIASVSKHYLRLFDEELWGITSRKT